MNYWLLLIPVISAFIGWLANSLLIYFIFHPLYPKKILGIKIQGIIPAKQQSMARQIGQLAAGLFSFNEIENKITNPANVEKIMPHIEQHIDNFLRVKLAEQMPMISMFIGEKTIAQLKGVFTEELKNLFPVIMQNYIGNLKTDFNIETLVNNKIAAVSMENLSQTFNKVLMREIKLIKIWGAAIGLIIGLLQLCFIFFFN
jgi:uncharacterized membrane protein YheB (UPF0754 family)